MAKDVLIVAEHQGGKITRSTWEAVAAGQRMVAESGGTALAVILGDQASTPASELATARLGEALVVQSPLLSDYTADGYVFSLQKVIRERAPDYVVLGHTYQTRDFAPKLATALGAGFISDCLGYRKEDGRLVFNRQVFQGKFEADVEPVGQPPWLVSF
ncbi:MAG: electron transfer flavoprotein subunit alpha/FixB family protein, partial [Terriglobia bacterium]